MVKSPKVHIIVVAAGSGTRFGADVPKQYVNIAGRPLLMRTIDALRHGMPHAGITLVAGAGQLPLWQALCTEYAFESPLTVEGGQTRWQSVRNGLQCVPADADIIMVHDGVRPFVDETMLRRLLDGIAVSGAVVPVVPVTDSIRLKTTDGDNCSVDRSLVFAVQTPQAFDADLLRNAYDEPFSPRFTDDASVVEILGARITMVDGDRNNIKVTNPIDRFLAEKIIESSNHRSH